MPNHKINGRRVQPEAVQGLLDELVMFRRYIHTNECSDENGWFASFCPEGKFNDEMFEYRSTGCETEEQAVQLLIKAACRDIRNMEQVGSGNQEQAP